MFHTVGIVESATFGTLGDNDDARLLRLADTTPHESRQLVNVGHFLRYNSGFSATGNGAVLCQETSIAPHHLNEKDALVRTGGVANAVNTLHDGVHRCIVTDGGISAVKVVVDGARQPNDGEVELHSKVACASQGTVASDDDQCIYLFLQASLIGFLLAFWCHELLAAGALQNCAALGDDATDILGGKLFYIIVDESIVTTIDALDSETVVNARTG